MVKKIMRITVLAGVLSFMAFGTRIGQYLHRQRKRP